MQSPFECLLCLLALSALAGWARAYWVYRNKMPRKMICFNFLGEIISSVVAATVAYAFLYHYGATNGFLFGGSLVGAYLGADLLEMAKVAAKAKLQIPDPDCEAAKYNQNKIRTNATTQAGFARRKRTSKNESFK